MKHCRRVGGEIATSIDLFWREDVPWVVLQLPSGRRTAVPVSWTDLTTERFASGKGQPEILPSGLIELARHCHGLRESRTSNKHSKKRSQDKKSS
jgi:hypothetical protein